MAYCEDFPCCGHELGCCPDRDPETGEQVNMKCTCGAVLPLNNPYSICNGCLARPDPDDPSTWDDEPEPDLDEEW